MTQVLTGATIGPVIMPVGSGLERRELQGRSALSLILTAVLPKRWLRAGWAGYLILVTLVVEWWRSSQKASMGVSNAVTFSYGYSRSGVLNHLHR
jgi:hypothetical protein